MSIRNQAIRSVKQPDRVLSYFALEKWTLLIVTVSGILYNVGMIAGPWFEGQLAQRLLEVISGRKTFTDMVTLAILYVLVIVLVQTARYIKRLYVRKFANYINRDMKQVLYGNIVHTSKQELEQEGAGNLMTKAILDVDTCSEGMRKFTTEVFDTGVVMIAYIVMLLFYDWKLTVLSLIFPPVAYFIAEKLKVIVSKSTAAYKESAGRLNSATMDRITNAVTYRVYGQENHMDELYEQSLGDYEKRAVFANVWETSMQPIYQMISMMSVIFILWFGGKNVMGDGWTVWNIAAFTTFLSCYTKLAVKSSKAAKLFNAVQKAKVSWKRIKPYMKSKSNSNAHKNESKSEKVELQVSHLSFRYGQEERYLFKDVSFELSAGQMLGVVGPVACGKSTLGRVFLGEYPYEGEVLLNGVQLSSMWQGACSQITAYEGHQPELLSASIEENILLGSTGDVMPYLQAVCMDREVGAMPDGIRTMIGNGGIRLSGGQQARIALARTLFHKKPIVVLDDPFSAVDLNTEQQIMKNIRPFIRESIVIIISHRLSFFPQLDRILWLKDNLAADHETLMKQSSEYAAVYQMQMGGKDNEAHE